MKTRLLKRSTERRAFLWGGLSFVFMGSVVAIWLREPQRRPIWRPPPVALTGRVVSRASGAGVAKRRVFFRRAADLPGGAHVLLGQATTDDAGRFQIWGDFQGLVDLFVECENGAPWTFRPVLNVRLPAKQPVVLELVDGVTITGRVEQGGKPVSGASIGLAPEVPISEDFSGVVEVRTDPQGAFVFPHLFERARFRLVSGMGTLPDHAVVAPHSLVTGPDGTTLDLGTLNAQPGHTLAGRVVFSDRSSPPADVDVSVFAATWFGSARARLDARGCFEIKGLPEGDATLQVFVHWDAPPSMGIAPAAGTRPILHTSHRLSPKNKCRAPDWPDRLEGQIDRDITDLMIVMDPNDRRTPEHREGPVDPARAARFAAARTGPITGVPP
jgi:hypothetical protein